MVKLFFLIQHEAHLDGQFVDAFAHFVAEVFHIFQSDGILLSSYNHLRLSHRCKHLVDAPDVLLMELMMVSIAERIDFRTHGRQVFLHLFG